MSMLKNQVNIPEVLSKYFSPSYDLDQDLDAFHIEITKMIGSYLNSEKITNVATMESC
jgi:hypothetical protein